MTGFYMKCKTGMPCITNIRKKVCARNAKVKAKDSK